jgi:mono/diheme cytochrome c family protein
MTHPFNRFLLPALAMLALLSGCKHSVNQSQFQLPPTAPISKGHELFLAHCASCHQGAGNPPGPNAIILDSESLKNMDTFTALLRQPRSAMMTAFSPETLPNKDVQTLYEYILTVKNPQPQR